MNPLIHPPLARRRRPRRWRAPLLAGPLLAAATLVAVQAAAESAPDEQTPPASDSAYSESPVPEASAPPVEVTDEKLRQFVAAATNVRDVQEEYVAEAQRLQEQTEQKMVASVEDAGMTIEEFQSISEQLQNDPELLERLDQIHDGGGEQ